MSVVCKQRVTAASREFCGLCTSTLTTRVVETCRVLLITS